MNDEYEYPENPTQPTKRLWDSLPVQIIRWVFLIPISSWAFFIINAAILLLVSLVLEVIEGAGLIDVPWVTIPAALIGLAILAGLLIVACILFASLISVVSPDPSIGLGLMGPIFLILTLLMVYDAYNFDGKIFAVSLTMLGIIMAWAMVGEYKKVG